MEKGLVNYMSKTSGGLPSFLVRKRSCPMPPTPSPLHEQFLLPPPAVREVVQHLLLLTVEAGAAPVVRTLLPTFQVVLFINLGPAAELWPATDCPALVPAYELRSTAVAGPLKTAWHYRLAAGARVLAVNFTLEGFYRLFQVPLDQLGAGLTDPDELLPQRCFAELRERLRPLTRPAQFGQVLADFCRPYLRPVEGAQAELLAHLPLLAHSPHLNPLRMLAAASHRSERAVQLRFQKYLGFSAKEAARFVRFRRVLADLAPRPDAAEKPDWLTLLEHHGYHDQSHLIHDFTHFLRQSPTSVARQLRAGEVICFTRTELLGA